MLVDAAADVAAMLQPNTRIGLWPQVLPSQSPHASLNRGYQIAAGLLVPTSAAIGQSEAEVSSYVEYTNATPINADVGSRSIISVQQCRWHVGFTPDCGRVAALPRTVETGPEAHKEITSPQPLVNIRSIPIGRGSR